jgi:hypothetical protein
MNNRWIKLYTKLIESDIFFDETAFRLFIYFLLIANSKGECRISYTQTSKFLKIPKSTLYGVITRIAKKYKIANTFPNGRFTLISICNWYKYQSTNRTVDRILTERSPNVYYVYKNKNKNNTCKILQKKETETTSISSKQRQNNIQRLNDIKKNFLNINNYAN